MPHKMMRKLFCWLGFHRYGLKPTLSGAAMYWFCDFCGVMVKPPRNYR